MEQPEQLQGVLSRAVLAGSHERDANDGGRIKNVCGPRYYNSAELSGVERDEEMDRFERKTHPRTDDLLGSSWIFLDLLGIGSSGSVL